jgi:hypothetical protein
MFPGDHHQVAAPGPRPGQLLIRQVDPDQRFLGFKVQATGQAPTDDSFTVITYDDTLPPDAPLQVTETRDGKYLLNDSEYPFESLKKHGQRFAAHFRLKKVNAPFLKTWPSSTPRHARQHHRAGPRL